MKIFDPSSQNVAIDLVSLREENKDRVNKDGFPVDYNRIYVADTAGRGAVTLQGDFISNALSIHDKYDSGLVALKAYSFSEFSTGTGLNHAVKRNRKTGKLSAW